MSEPSSFGSSGRTGHTMAQLAACRHSVGISLIAAPALYELAGSYLDVTRIGSALGAGEASAGSSAETRWGWWHQVTPCRALVLADPMCETALERVLSQQAAFNLDVAVRSLSARRAGLVLAGPRASRLASSSIVHLADPVMTVSSGQDYWLLVIRRTRVLNTLRALLELGGPDGAVSVEQHATDLYRAAQRVSADRHARTVYPSLPDMPRTGVPFHELRR